MNRLFEQLRDAPYVIRKSQRHGGGHADRFMHAAEVVVGDERAEGRPMIIQLLAEATRQPCESPGLHAGLQRHRVLWLREMSKEEIRQVEETGPTIDSIEIAEFGSNETLKEWVGTHAPAFVR
jgi:hypothetical protein